MIDDAFVIPMWDIHPDGKRFLMIKPSWAASPEVANKIGIVLNWFEELKQRVPKRRSGKIRISSFYIRTIIDILSP
jgi:pectate lyase